MIIMKISIISPEKEIFNGETILVQLPGSEGSFAILPGHDKLIATLTEGNVRVVINEKETQMIPIKGGIVEVKDNNILVLAK